MTKRTTLYALLCLNPFMWGGLLLFTYFIPPHTIFAFGAFFLILSLALTSFFAPLSYMVSLRFLSSRLYRATVRHALRQGILLSLCIVLNLILRALHSWNLFMAAVIFATAIVIEIISLGRK